MILFQKSAILSPFLHIFFKPIHRRKMIRNLLALLILLITSNSPLLANKTDTKFQESIVKCISNQIFMNECSGKIEKLTWWNKGEAFPSFGIGHAIWYPTGVEAPYQESFPDLINYYRLKSVRLPDWLEALKPFKAPWLNRKQFFQDFDGKKLSTLRDFLYKTRDIQIEFIILRLQRTIPLLNYDQSIENQKQMNQKISKLLTTPNGYFALTDYINFKGDGTLPQESYQNQGWGVLQVLEGMPELRLSDNATAVFSESARNVLIRRINNSPPEKNEKQYLKGWQNRLKTYKTFSCLTIEFD